MAISRLALSGRTHLGRLTASIGIASYPEHGDHLDELLAAADRAMYAAKHGGETASFERRRPPSRSRVTPAGPRPGRQLRVESSTPRRAG